MLGIVGGGMLLFILFLLVERRASEPILSLSLSIIAQNVVSASRLSVSTAATRYLGQLGATLGIAIVGTVVSSSISGTLLHRLPTTAAERAALAGALQHGFVAVLVSALIALLAAFFLKDVPFTSCFL